MDGCCQGFFDTLFLSELNRTSNVIGAFVDPTQPCRRAVEVAKFGEVRCCLIGSG